MCRRSRHRRQAQALQPVYVQQPQTDKAYPQALLHAEVQPP